MIGGCKVNMKIILFWSQLWVWKYWDNIFLFNCLRIWNSIVTILGYPFPCGRYHFTNIFLEGRQKQGFIFLQFGGEGSQIDMLPSKYIKVSYFWPKSAKKSFYLFCLLKFDFFPHKTNSKYHIWIMLMLEVPKCPPPPRKVGLKGEMKDWDWHLDTADVIL